MLSYNTFSCHELRTCNLVALCTPASPHSSSFKERKDSRTLNGSCFVSERGLCLNGTCCSLSSLSCTGCRPLISPSSISRALPAWPPPSAVRKAAPITSFAAACASSLDTSSESLSLYSPSPCRSAVLLGSGSSGLPGEVKNESVRGEKQSDARRANMSSEAGCGEKRGQHSRPRALNCTAVGSEREEADDIHAPSPSIPVSDFGSSGREQRHISALCMRSQMLGVPSRSHRMCHRRSPLLQRPADAGHRGAENIQGEEDAGGSLPLPSSCWLVPGMIPANHDAIVARCAAAAVADALQTGRNWHRSKPIVINLANLNWEKWSYLSYFKLFMGTPRKPSRRHTWRHRCVRG